jgi:flagellar assembly factor FliW
MPNADGTMTDAEKIAAYDAGTGISGFDKATNFDLNNFDALLNRLEASKGRQQRQKSVEGRRDIFQQGLASMMSNF